LITEQQQKLIRLKALTIAAFGCLMFASELGNIAATGFLTGKVGLSICVVLTTVDNEASVELGAFRTGVY
jgi:hypothetical protein